MEYNPCQETHYINCEICIKTEKLTEFFFWSCFVFATEETSNSKYGLISEFLSTCTMHLSTLNDRNLNKKQQKLHKPAPPPPHTIQSKSQFQMYNFSLAKMILFC